VFEFIETLRTLERPMSIIVDTVNFHINSRCNAECVYCYRDQSMELPHEAQCAIVDAIAGLRATSPNLRRINFAGGEPTLVKTLPDLIRRAKQAGLETSVITNGSVLAKVGLAGYLPWLDMVGISIDSLNASTNAAIRRPHIDLSAWVRFAEAARRAGVYLKINTVVSRQNCHEDLRPLIAAVNPDRWKILRAMKVEELNSQNYFDWRASDVEFHAFVQRHKDTHIAPVVEDDDALRGSYAMIAPDGRFYDSTQGAYRKSSPILAVGIKDAFAQVQCSMDEFLKRGGRYSIAGVGR
jgi:radical S-adenosyl methionine domain-containing protein 2